MTADLKIALAQINPTMGDLDGNLALLREARAQAAALGADLLVCPEMCLVGYPPDDLVRKDALLRSTMTIATAFARETADEGPAVLFGAPWRDSRKVLNAALLAQGGLVTAWRAKHELPNYGVFDDKRVFDPGPIPGPIPLRCGDGSTVRLGVMICEDMWFPDVAEGLEESGAELLICLNASPFEHAKRDQRITHAVARVAETGLPLLACMLVGGQDELVFDGGSFAITADRRLALQAPMFEQGVWLTRWRRGRDGWDCIEAPVIPPVEGVESIWRAMVLGLRDYVRKNRFPGVVLGLSGGIDSAVTAAVAVDALGADAVHAVMMPSRYTSKASLEDAAETARLLGIGLETVPIEPAVAAFREMLAPIFADRPDDLAEENIQSRIRGMTLMAISNKLGPMVLTTGNKSELAVGYATLYGDMCGGYSVVKDVYKTTILSLCRWRNSHRPADALGPEGPVMPERVISKQPSAELRAGQADHDSLPNYEVLDRILEGLVENDRSPRELVLAGLPAEEVRKVSNLLDIAEFKRRQASPGVKITRKAFGRDRRYPITNSFRRVGISDLDQTPEPEAAAAVHSATLRTIE